VNTHATHATYTELQRVIVWLVAIVGLLALSSLASAQVPRLDVIELKTSNDLISGSDDLYTAELGLAVNLDGHLLRFDEKMFTDRGAGRRHDETSLTLSVNLEPWLGVPMRGAVGGLRVGQGVLGEQVQNNLHRLVGSDAVDLDYPENNRYFPVLGLHMPWSPGTVFGERLEGSAQLLAAPGFRSSLAVGVTTEHHLTAGFSAELGVGAMANVVQSELLEDHVEPLLPTWSVGVAWRKIALSWSSNTYGTRQRHIALAFRFSPATGKAEEECC